jgi:hypothetical protein
MGRIQVTIVTLFSMTLVTLGCGGTSGTSKSLTRAELIAKADTICKRINKEIAFYSSLTPASSQDLVSKSAVARAVPRISSIESATGADLGKLTAPSAMAGDWRQIVVGVQTLADDTRRYGEAIQKGNGVGTSAVALSSARLLQRINALAARDGFADCAKLE